MMKRTDLNKERNKYSNERIPKVRIIEKIEVKVERSQEHLSFELERRNRIK